MRTTVDLTLTDDSTLFPFHYVWTLQVEVEGHSGTDATFSRMGDPPEMEITGLNIMGLELQVGGSAGEIKPKTFDPSFSQHLKAELKEVVLDVCEGKLLAAIMQAENERDVA